ncbi:MAG: hypothetical protein KIT31_20645, partial [Deltaproteobacteria bacterium]|nr:hypothetical protein [Deltaproteobacteria bacterium]
VAPGSPDCAELGRRIAPDVGAVFVPTARGLRSPERFLFEARVRALSPLFPCAWLGTRTVPALPSVIVVADEAEAARLSLPIALRS